MSRQTATPLAAGLLVAGLLGLGGCSGDAGAADPDAESAPRNTAEVVTTDLIEETEYEATLGRLAGNPVTSAREGTVTSVAEPGVTLGNGSVLYSIDGEPVVGLLGDTPAYRTLTEFAEPLGIAAPTEGVITWLPEPGTEIGHGSVVMRIDGRPVIALVGSVPAYRDLRDLPENMTGDDVLQLEYNLAAIGLAEVHDVDVDGEFTRETADALAALQAWLGTDDDGSLDLGEYVVIPQPGAVVDTLADVGGRAGADPVLTLPDGDAERMRGPDVAQLNAALAELGHLDAAAAGSDEFTAATADAVRAFQEERGMEADGSLDVGELRFLPAPVRVASVGAPVGTVVNVGSEVFAVTGEEILVTFDLPAEDQGSVAAGDGVTVELPDGTPVGGSVTEVATVAEVGSDGPVFPVEISLDPSALEVAAGLDEAPVDVAFVSDAARGVTAVPVAALVALREGGYAVDVVDGAGTRLVAVEPGMFADGLVEVAGEVGPGDVVVVP